MTSEQYIQEYIERARSAQKKIESYSQDQVDQLVKAVGKTVYDNAEELARLAVEETGMGVYEDKVKKNRGKSSIIWNSLRHKPSVGIIERNEETGIVKIAKPVGIVAAITPTTNPTVTPMCNIMFALKGRNAIIITPHHRSFHSSSRTVEKINAALRELGAPDNLVQIIDEQSRENTRNLIAAADVVVATGGMGMVKAAYSSGKPAFGVGAGNVQCIIDRDADYEKAVPQIITGRCFDNGIICSGEQTVIVPEEAKERIVALFRQNGAAYLADQEKAAALRKTLFHDGHMNKDVVGQPVGKIAALAGIDIPEETRVILVDADGPGAADLFSKEKMCPVLALYTYNEFSEAVAIAEANLELEGKGHSVALHSHTREHIEAAALRLSASRFVINQPSSLSAGGSFFNGFAPTTTLGCGTWGNNSISENLDYKHLLNISRIGYHRPGNHAPTETELWD